MDIARFFSGAAVVAACLALQPSTAAAQGNDALAPGVYHIIWKAGTTDYMTERADGTMGIAPFATNSGCFWQIDPVEGKTNVYTVRSVASGKYISSCNLTPSSASKISTTTTPTEYYIGLTTSTDSNIAGCRWMSSTDCTDYSDETKGPRALNKDGASNDIIAWQAGHSRKNSYWRIVPAETTYEVRPFTPSPEVGRPVAVYSLTDAAGNALGNDGWKPLSLEADDQGWYFVGESNAEGYDLVNASTHRSAFPDGSRYAVVPAATKGLYSLANPSTGTLLYVNGVVEFAITPRRTAYALHTQIYSMPCGSTGSSWIATADLDGCPTPLRYPLAATTGNTIGRTPASKPGAGYTMFTRSRATVAAGGEATLSVTLGGTPAAGTTLTAYTDFDRNGVFDTAIPMAIAGNAAEATVKVPATAPAGSSRLRLRLTDNGLEGADDEVSGQTLDLIVNVTDDAAEPSLTVVSSDPSRGTATTDGLTARASAKGSAAFLVWMEGNNPVSLDAEFTPELTRPMTLTAMFTPNLNDVFGGIVAAPSAGDVIAISAEGRRVSAPGATAIALFGVNGALAARGAGDYLDASTLAPGIYIAVAVAPTGTARAKIILE